MRSRLRLFALLGLVATGVDLGLLLVLSDRWSLVAADAAALSAAAIVAYLLNRFITFRGSPDARWVRSPIAFAATATLAGLVDIGTLVVFDAVGMRLLLAKVFAVGAAAALRWTGYRWVLFNTVRRELSERRDRTTAPGDLRLSVVVPAYNEAGNIATTIERLGATIGQTIDPSDFEVLVVDDGSTDETALVAQEAGARVLRQGRNQGKGAAIRTGVTDARGRSVVFTDADLAYPPAMVVAMLEELENGWDFVAGSRRHDETTTLVKARRLRELGGRAVNWLTHLVLLGHFHDTQCGIKGFRGDVGRTVFERTVINGFAFDVELFLMAEQDRLSVLEVPVSVENRSDSSVQLVADTIRFLRDLVRIRRRAGNGGYRPSYHQSLILDGTLVDSDG